MTEVSITSSVDLFDNSEYSWQRWLDNPPAKIDRPSKPQVSLIRSTAIALTIALHAILLYLLWLNSFTENTAVIIDKPMFLEFIVPVDIESVPLPDIAPPTDNDLPVSIPNAKPSLAEQKQPIKTDSIKPVDRPMIAEELTPAQSPPLRVFDSNGQPLISQTLLDKFDQAGEPDFKQKDGELLKQLIERPPPIEYRSTRFAKAWQPSETLIDEWLKKAVEKTSGSVRVPLNPRFNLVCGGSILGVIGGCRIVRNAGTGVIVERPPAPPWQRTQRVQCQQFTQQLENANNAEAAAEALSLLQTYCLDRK